jgi:hypothetical protein
LSEEQDDLSARAVEKAARPSGEIHRQEDKHKHPNKQINQLII